MMKMTGNTENDERGLLPYPVIIAATKGDPQAMSIVVQQYESYISCSLQSRTAHPIDGIECPQTSGSSFATSKCRISVSMTCVTRQQLICIS